MNARTLDVKCAECARLLILEDRFVAWPSATDDFCRWRFDATRGWRCPACADESKERRRA